MALGFWGVALPLIIFGIFFVRTTAERIVVLIGAGLFLLTGWFISKAKT